MRHVLSLFDLTSSEIRHVLDRTRELKQDLADGKRPALLQGRTMALLFEKPSLRTRVSFESGMAQLGGSALFLGSDVGWGKRESIQDFSRVLGQYVDAIVCRAKSHVRVEELAAYAPCSVINGLTDYAHPCQALADLFTLEEIHGTLTGKHLAYIGDAFNVARSLAIACGKLGVALTIASPPSYQMDQQFVSELREAVPQLDLRLTDDPREAVRDADGIYTDVWTSMGQEAEREQRIGAFADYQVNANLMSAAPQRACFLHCLPANRGEEVTDEVMDGPQSAVIQQAANRMHVQKGLLVWLLTEQGAT